MVQRLVKDESGVALGLAIISLTLLASTTIEIKDVA